MKEKNKKPEKLPMQPGKKAALRIAGIIGICAIVYIAYYLIHFTFFNRYREYLDTYEVEAGTEYAPLPDSDNKVKGYDLVAENEMLKLYTDTKTGYIAVYDKRDGSVTYSNPPDADADETANSKNKNFLKSAFMLGYYNSGATVGTFDCYSNSTRKHNFTVESLADGVRYRYTVGDVEKKDTGVAIYFEIPLEYRLDGDSVVVSIPTSEIKEEGAGFVYNIQLLRYFGAAHKSESGYLVVPNASGSLINFNNGKTTASNYQQYYYDIDPLVANYTTLENVSPARLALYGICREDRSLLVTVEEGASIAALNAGVSGNFNDYNYAYSTFVLRNTDNLRMFGNSTSDVYVMEDELYDMNIQVRYTFLTKEYKGYDGLANYYREKLISNGVLTKATGSSDIPLYYDILAGVEETRHTLGVRNLQILKMTTFSQAGEIALDLSEAGVKSQVMNLQGWTNGGYYNDRTTTLRVLLKLGGKRGLSELKKTLESVNGKLYADVALQKMSEASNFPASAEGSRYYGAGYTASFGMVNPTTLRNIGGMGYRENIYTVVSPKYLVRYGEALANRLKSYDITGIGLRDLGSYLASDKRRTNVISREQALDVVEAELKLLEDTGKSLLINEANDYAFAYADDIINAPCDDNDYFIIDERIPLYGMILHGCISYSSELLNYDEGKDITPALLRLIENGAAPHYVFTYQESSKMKETALNRYYATTYSTWRDEAVYAYKYVNEALSSVSNACMTQHEIISSEVRRVTYDNGIRILINYGSEDAVIDGITVPALSYRLEGK